MTPRGHIQPGPGLGTFYRTHSLAVHQQERGAGKWGLLSIRRRRRPTNQRYEGPCLDPDPNEPTVKAMVRTSGTFKHGQSIRWYEASPLLLLGFKSVV